MGTVGEPASVEREPRAESTSRPADREAGPMPAPGLSGISPARVLAMQRAIGNQATARWLESVQRRSGRSRPETQESAESDLARRLARDASDEAKTDAPKDDAAKTSADPKLSHYRFEIKAWIPIVHVPDPEELLHRANFPLPDKTVLTGYDSEYRGDGHTEYEGGYRVFNTVEFDWDGQAITNIVIPPVAHFGTSHRDWTATLQRNKDLTSGAEVWTTKGTDEATTDHAVTNDFKKPAEVDLGMHSPNPLTIFPAPDIDADYSLFVSANWNPSLQRFEDTVTVRWSTDFMPNHGYRVFRDGALVKEHIVRQLPHPPSAAEIAVWLTSKDNGGADMFDVPRAQ